MLNPTNMSNIKSDFFSRWYVIIGALQILYIKPLQWIWSHVKATIPSLEANEMLFSNIKWNG